MGGLVIGTIGGTAGLFTYAFGRCLAKGVHNIKSGLQTGTIKQAIDGVIAAGISGAAISIIGALAGWLIFEMNGGVVGIFSEQAFKSFYRDWQGFADSGEIVNADVKTIAEVLNMLLNPNAAENNATPDKDLISGPAGFFSVIGPTGFRKDGIIYNLIAQAFKNKGKPILMIKTQPFYELNSLNFEESLEEAYTISVLVKNKDWEGLEYLLRSFR